MEGQCFLNIYSLNRGICAVPDTVAYCNVEYWLMSGVLAAEQSIDILYVI
jgi:hypothetical protein